MAESYRVTSAGVNPAEDRAHRMRMYFVAMALRVLCVVSLFWVQGWWVLVVAAGAVLLPWFAVMVGNAVAHTGEEESPTVTPLSLEAGEHEQSHDTARDAAGDDDVSELVIVIDAVPATAPDPAPHAPPYATSSESPQTSASVFDNRDDSPPKKSPAP